MSEGDYYTVSQAAKVLKVTTGRIRQMLGSGELGGEKDVNGRWRILAHLIHDRPRPGPRRRPLHQSGRRIMQPLAVGTPPKGFMRWRWGALCLTNFLPLPDSLTTSSSSSLV